LRAQPTNSSFLVVRYSKAPEGAGRPSGVLDQQHQEHAQGREQRAGERLGPQGPQEEEHGLQVEQDEDDGDRVVLDRDRLDVDVLDRGGAALERLKLERAGRRLGADHLVEP